MADTIKATPRNRLLGLLADGFSGLNDFAAKPLGGIDNPPTRLLSGLLGIPAIANTLNEMSYGGAMGTGAGMTWRPKADTVNAALAVSPFAAVTPGLINKGAAEIGRRVEPAVGRWVNNTLDRGGLPAQLLQDMSKNTISRAINPFDYNLPVNKDGTVTLLHGTNKDSAKQILSTGRLKSAGEPDVFLTNTANAGYGDGTVLSVNVDPKRLFIDDEFPSGRFDFRLPALNGQAAISRPKLFAGDKSLELPASNTVSIPVSPEFYTATGAKEAKMLADIERLYKKHPKEFESPSAVEAHLINAFGSKPNFVAAASEPKYTLTTTPAGLLAVPTGEPYRAAVTDLRGINGGNYQVISAFPMSEKQLDIKKTGKK